MCRVHVHVRVDVCCVHVHADVCIYIYIEMYAYAREHVQYIYIYMDTRSPKLTSKVSTDTYGSRSKPWGMDQAGYAIRSIPRSISYGSRPRLRSIPPDPYPRSIPLIYEQAQDELAKAHKCFADFDRPFSLPCWVQLCEW